MKKQLLALIAICVIGLAQAQEFKFSKKSVIGTHSIREKLAGDNSLLAYDDIDGDGIKEMVFFTHKERTPGGEKYYGLSVAKFVNGAFTKTDCESTFIFDKNTLQSFATVGDLDNDGDKDLALIVDEKKAYVYFWNETSNEYKSVSYTSVVLPNRWDAFGDVCINDVNKDGKADIIWATNKFIVTDINTTVNANEVTFNPTRIKTDRIITNSHEKVVFQDMNADGNMDIITNFRSEIYVHIGKGDGTFSTKQYSVGSDNMQIRMGTFAHKKSNICILQGIDGSNYTLKAVELNEDNTATATTVYSKSSYYKYYIMDLNGDGLDDILINDERSDYDLKVLLNKGGATFSETPQTTIDNKFDHANRFIVCDYNNDNVMELIAFGREDYSKYKMHAYEIGNTYPKTFAKTADDKQFTYNGTSHAFEAQAPTGYSLKWYDSMDATTEATSSVKNAGKHESYAAVVEDATGFESFARTKATINIDKVELTAAAVDVSRTYGATNPEYTVNYTGFVNSENEDAIKTKATISTSATAISPVGEYEITPTNAEADNYSFKYTPAKLTVTKAELTIKADAKTKIYGAANPELTITYSGFVNSEDESALTTKPSIATNADVSSAVDQYNITVSGAAADNYTFKYEAAKLTVNKAVLKVIAKDFSRTYGDENPVFIYTFDGFVNSDDENALSILPTITCDADKNSDVSDYAIELKDGVADNYSFNYIKGKLTVLKAQLTAAAEAKSRAYGATNPEFTVKYTGFVNSDGASELTSAPTATTLADENSNAGEYEITVSGGTASNYTFVYENAKLTINKVELTAAAEAKSRGYGTDNPEFTVKYTGFVNSEDASELTSAPTATTLADKNSNAGEYEITISGGTANNYSFIYEGAKLTVNKANATITADNKTKLKGEVNPAFTFSVDGLMNNEDESIFTTQPNFTCSAITDSPVGTYPIEILGADATNYSFIYVDGTLTVKTSTDIDNTNANSFKAYPNPTTGIIYLEGVEFGDDYAIYSLSGAMVKQGVVDAKKLNITDFNSGIYILKINDKVVNIIKE